MLKNKTVIVTGASRGIGKEIALKFALQGANIVLNYRNDEPKELANEIMNKRVKCLPFKADVSNFDEAKGLIDAAKNEFGTIDVLVNNAGITKDMLMLRMKEQEFDDVINTNLKGTFNTIRHVCPIMLKQKSGSIINMASVVGVLGNIGQANYAASKAGIIGLTKSVAREMAQKGVTCNAIAPGFIETDMTDILSDSIKEKTIEQIPLKRFGKAGEVAELACFLAVSQYITGQVIHIDGGMAM